MNSLHCLKCGSGRIVVGEAGAPSRCADCGGTSFAGVSATASFKVLERVAPLETTIKVWRRAECPPERARQLFAEIHRAIEAAGKGAA